ncbi:MAG TPA: hypothetical protein VLL52_17650 [Anaerolineae bacterium]|nr:hypothetical protein [Anaerolineae bacterium]
MYKSNYYLLLVLLCGLLLVACGGGETEPEANSNSNDTSNTTETEVGTDDGERGSEPEMKPTAVALDSNDDETSTEDTGSTTNDEAPTGPMALSFNPSRDIKLDALQTYRLDLTMNFEGTDGDGNAVSAGMVGQVMISKEPPASSLSLTMTGMEDELGTEELTFTSVQLGDAFYLDMGELGCMTGSSADMGEMVAEFDSLTDPSEIMSEIEDAPFVGVETHGGVASDCYEFDESNLTEEEKEGVESGTGKICIAQEGEYVTYISLDVVGEDDVFETGGQGRMFFEMAFTDVNETFKIDPPATCDAVESLGYPVLDDATDMAQFGSMMTYGTTTSFNDAIDFYRAEMSALGYSEGDDTLMLDNSMASMNFSKDGDTVTVAIIVNGETVQVTVGQE